MPPTLQTTLLALTLLIAGSACQTRGPLAEGAAPDDPDAAATQQGADASHVAGIAQAARGPFADRDPGPDFSSYRVCYARPKLFSADRASAARRACPSRRELIDLGEGPVDDPKAMAGCKTIDQGPVEWRGDCCYLFAGCTHL